VTCGRSVVFSGYSGFICHDITEILLKVSLNTVTLTPQSRDSSIEKQKGDVFKNCKAETSDISLSNSKKFHITHLKHFFMKRNLNTEFQVLAWDRHEKVTELNRLMRS
jgi:hypothetical protein